MSSGAAPAQRDLVEVTVGEGGAVKALRRRSPAELSVETVDLVVAGIGLHRRLRCGQVGELLAVEHCGLQRLPERLDLAAGSLPNRITAPFVHGVSIWVRMWRMASSSRPRWKRLSTVRTMATKGVPLSAISSSGTPHSSTASPSSSRREHHLGRAT